MINNYETEIYIKIILALSKMMYDGYDSTTMMVLEKSLRKELNKMNLNLSEDDLKLGLSQVIRFAEKRDNKNPSTEEILQYIKICIKNHRLADLLGSSLIGETLSKLIELEFNVKLAGAVIEIIMEEYIDGYKEQQLERKQALREMYNIKKGKNNE